MKKQTTIKDIAKIVNVSPTTVSLALKNHPRLSEKTREEVQRVAKELNYTPNLLARSLIRGRSLTLGLTITTIRNPFYMELAKGIEDAAHDLGYNIILCSTNYDITLEKYYIETLRSKGVDGIIFSSVEVKDPNIKSLLKDDYPFVLVNRRVKDRVIDRKIDTIVLDNYTGGYMALEHLVKLGHERIALLTGDRKTSTAMERTDGAKKLLKDVGIRIDPKLLCMCNFSRESAYRATKNILSMKNPPSALFAINDHMALGAREAILESGLKIPEDVALIGFDNIDITSLQGIEITTIRQKKYEMGALATRLLIDRIEKKSESKAKQIILDPELVIRKSCGYPVDLN